jgi:DNA helicase-2/ATP-dependent DNA helicase PcrA
MLAARFRGHSMISAPTREAEPAPIPGLEDDEEGAQLVREELRLLATVQRALLHATSEGAAAAQGRAGDDQRLLELRDEVSTAKPEDLPALFEQMHHLGALRAQRGKSVTGSVDAASPYFGHLRLEEDGKRRDVLVGGRSYLDSRAGIRIVDWRNAPVSRIYYRYGEGDSYEEPLGGRVVEGEVLARRGVAIVAGVLKRVASPQGTFVRGNDGMWKRAQSHTAKLATPQKWTRGHGGKMEAPKLGIDASGSLRQDKHLPAIASMLDPKQFDLITRPGAGLVAIQGSAGSGKTTVGLHRVAFLAFADPQKYRSDRMMVVVPNEALVHYVDRVLPTLGVEGVPVTTFARWAGRVVTSLFPKLPTYFSEETPPVVSRAKRHPAMIHAIDAAATRAMTSIDKRLRAAMTKWPEGETVVRAWEATNKGAATPDTRVTALASWLAGKRTLEGAPLATSLPDVTRSALEQLGHEVRSIARGVLGTWDELLTGRERLAATFEGIPGFGPGQLDQVHDWCVRQARVRAEGERDGETASLDTEDAALLLRTWQTMRGSLVDGDGKPLRLSHLFVDEVQDASPVELSVLLDLTGQERNVTLAGDVAQRMLDAEEEHAEFDWAALLKELGMPHAAIEPLQVSYRSTAEITSFARKVLGPLAHDAEPIATRRGPPVELFTFAGVGEAVAFLADALRDLTRDEPYANVALVARFPQQAEAYFDGLSRAEVPRVRRVAQQDFTWEPGVDVTDVRQTKGLEFDEVILLDTTATSYPRSSPHARHAMYVGATRAAHQLWCIASDEPSDLVTESLDAPPPAAPSP